jgi:plastocyanin
MGAGLRTGWGLAVVAGVVVGWAMGCGGGGGGGDIVDPGGTSAGIRVEVSRDGGGASGVSVRLYGSGSGDPQATRSTGSDGTALFQGLSTGSYEVEVVVPSGAELTDGAARRPVAVTAGSTATVVFALATVGAGPIVDVLVLDNLTFSQASLQVAVGTTVRWVNQGSMLHTITPDGHSEWTEATLASTGAVFTHTFTEPGTFPYYCAPHQSAGMTGVVTVQ